MTANRISDSGRGDVRPKYVVAYHRDCSDKRSLLLGVTTTQTSRPSGFSFHMASRSSSPSLLRPQSFLIVIGRLACNSGLDFSTPVAILSLPSSPCDTFCLNFASYFVSSSPLPKCCFVLVLLLLLLIFLFFFAVLCFLSLVVP